MRICELCCHVSTRNNTHFGNKIFTQATGFGFLKPMVCVGTLFSPSAMGKNSSKLSTTEIKVLQECTYCKNFFISFDNINMCTVHNYVDRYID